jgi:predicted  nucleic acid-binding Zn-ribbon protein
LSTLSLSVAEKDRQVSSLQREIAALQRQSTQESGSAGAKEEINQLKTEIAEWRGKFERLDNIRREL